MNQAEIKRRQAQAVAEIIALVTLAVTARLTGYNGVAYVAVALEVFGFFHTLVSGGVSDGLGRMLRIRNSKGQYRNADLMRRNVTVFQLVLGAVGTLAVMAAAGDIAEQLFRVQYSSFILLIIGPVVFLRSVSEVLVGFCKGEGAELPAAAAGILRQLLILVFGMLFCKLLGGYGNKVSHLLVQENFASMYGGVGVAVGVTLAEVLVVVFLLLIYRGSRRRTVNKGLPDGMRITASFADSVRTLCVNRSIPMGIRLLVLFFLPVGLILFQGSTGDEDAAFLYGVYLAGYGMVCGICTLLVTMTTIPVCGRTMAFLRREEHRFARTVFQSGVHISIAHTAFAAAFLTAMAKQAAEVFCPGQEELAAKMFRGGSFLIVLVVLSWYFGRTLMLAGKKILVLGAVSFADVIFLLAAAVLLKVGKAGILSLVYAGIMGGGVLCIVLGMLAYRQLRVRADWLQILVVPAAAACVSGFFGMLLAKVLSPHMSGFVTLLVCFVITAALYWAGLLLLRNFREQELESIPGGRLINAVGQLMRVF